MAAIEVRSLRTDNAEIAEVAFRGVQELDRLAPARLARRLRLAVQAESLGRAVYAEHGADVTPNVELAGSE